MAHCEVGVKSRAQKPHLASGYDLRADVEKWLSHDGAVLQNPDLASLLDDKKAVACVVSYFEIQRRRKAGGNKIERKQRWQPGVCRSARRRR